MESMTNTLEWVHLFWGCWVYIHTKVSRYTSEAAVASLAHMGMEPSILRCMFKWVLSYAKVVVTKAGCMVAITGAVPRQRASACAWPISIFCVLCSFLACCWGVEHVGLRQQSSVQIVYMQCTHTSG